MQLTSKLPDVGTSIFTRIGGLTKATGALNLAQGFPDFGVDKQLPELISHYAQAGYNQYAPDIGIPALRQAISQKKERLYGYAPDPEREITVTIGATEAIFSSLQALIHPGDEVIFFEPAYDSYLPGIRLAGGVPIAITLEPPYFQIDWQAVRDQISAKTRMIIINNPHNPSGTILGPADFEQLSQILVGTNILLLSDEVYQHLTYDDQPHLSILRFPELYQRAVVTMSFGKTFHATGWRVGYAIAPPPISAEIRRIHQFNTFSAHSPTQYALADYLAEPKHYLKLPKLFEQKRDRFLGQLDGPFRVLPCQGSYFACLDFSEHWTGTDLELAEHLIHQYGIASIPLGEFYAQPRKTGILRFCFAKKGEKLDRAAALLNALPEEL